MLKIYNTYLACFTLLLITVGVNAQTPCSGSFGLQNDQVVIHGNDSVTIYGDWTNHDSAAIHADGVLTFFGEKWINDSNSVLDLAGTIQLSNPRPAPYAATFKQYIDNSGKESSYPHLIVDNPNNVELMDNTVVRDSLSFLNGKIILNGKNLTIANANAEAIKGYDQDKYVVTGSGTTGGFLIRNGVSGTTVDFPVGTSTASYTPASIANSGTTDNFSVRVFNDVFRDGTSGISEAAQGVNRTWDIHEETTGGSNVTLSLQHNTADEGASFDAAKHFVSHYIGTSPNTAGDTTSLSKWDLVFQANMGAGSSTGTITTGSPIANAVVTTRSGFTSFSPFTKSGFNNAAPLPIEIIEFTAVWNQEDANVTWTTASEYNNNYFELYRSLDQGNSFELVTKIESKAPNGNSSQMLYYNYLDNNIKSDVDELVTYKLIQYDYNNTSQEIGPAILKVDDQSDQLATSVFPNPANQIINIEVNNIGEKDLTISLTNILGEILEERTGIHDSGLQTFNTTGLMPGIYFVNLETNDLRKTVKVLIQH